MKVLNIARYLPIKGFLPENDITLKIYFDLKKNYNIESKFVMPLFHIPKWSTYFKKSLQKRYQIINNDYTDHKYNFKIYFFQALYPFLIFKFNGTLEIYNILIQYKLYKKELLKVVENYQPDIIHAHTVFDAIYAYKIYQKYKIPYIITLRGSFFEAYNSKVIRKVLMTSKRIITPSARLKRDLDKKYIIELLPHGVNKVWFNNKRKTFNPKKIKLITVARLLDWKNIQIVIKSIDVLVNKGYNIEYTIVGEGYYKDYLNSLVVKYNLLNRITFIGYKSRSELIDIYNKNEIFILLSYPETFGRAYYEAAAQGLLLIGRKNTGIDGYFTDDEAFIIEPSIENVYKVIETINNDLFIKMTNKSSQKIKTFENDKIIDRYFNILLSARSKNIDFNVSY